MPTILGTGEHRYRVVENFAKLPDGWSLTDVASVAVDSKDRIYVFNRGEHPMVVFDREGNFLRSWGEGVFARAHGLHIDADDNLYCTDDGDHTVRKCSADGKVLLTIGIPNKPAPFMSGEPFHRCTHTALSPKGEILCCCGGGKQPNFVIGELGPGMAVNRKVPNLGPRLSIVDGSGKRIARLGGEQGPGVETGKFLAPHGIALDSRGDIYVGEVGVTDWKTSFPDTEMPAAVRLTRCLQKLERVTA